jgi:hypothetical protein
MSLAELEKFIFLTDYGKQPGWKGEFMNPKCRRGDRQFKRKALLGFLEAYNYLSKVYQLCLIVRSLERSHHWTPLIF